MRASAKQSRWLAWESGIASSLSRLAMTSAYPPPRSEAERGGGPHEVWLRGYAAALRPTVRPSPSEVDDWIAAKAAERSEKPAQASTGNEVDPEQSAEERMAENARCQEPVVPR